MRVAFQGEPGAYSEQALLEAVPGAESLPAPLLRDVFELLAHGRAELAVVPCENSQAGSINETYDLLLEYADTLCIRGEHELRVRHCLLAPTDTPIDAVRRAYSHPQALAQTANWLRGRDIQPVAYHDTAGAARWVAAGAGDPGAAAVASKRAADVYGLQVLAEGIEDNPTNRTRFLVVGHEPAVPDAVEGKTSLVFSTQNRPGALYNALGCLAAEQVNLLKLESRPSRGEGWEYVFYVDCSGWATDPALAAALEALTHETGWVRVLGSYPRSV
ncbi:MAG: prephenate dehydratase [Chloroflexota bacterium]|nr:prephenate dehydratase [Chloroflexota bacterium]